MSKLTENIENDKVKVIRIKENVSIRQRPSVYNHHRGDPEDVSAAHIYDDVPDDYQGLIMWPEVFESKVLALGPKIDLVEHPVVTSADLIAYGYYEGFPYVDQFKKAIAEELFDMKRRNDPYLPLEPIEKKFKWIRAYTSDYVEDEEDDFDEPEPWNEYNWNFNKIADDRRSFEIESAVKDLVALDSD
ncbi:unnamed protein product [Caenorhabditis bovis]|uniref:Uncharacterized protein n=1 Tax=Caenorhabditis bovis TaxID=2654633 RepID=A0A8S1EJ62_9PELO|nr:unnamed protein product [Caenorhabditis bovis]